MKTKTVYMANDGREFLSQEACANWEKGEHLRTQIIGKLKEKFGERGYLQYISMSSVAAVIQTFLFEHYHLASKYNGQGQHSCDNNR